MRMVLIGIIEECVCWVVFKVFVFDIVFGLENFENFRVNVIFYFIDFREVCF